MSARLLLPLLISLSLLTGCATQSRGEGGRLDEAVQAQMQLASAYLRQGDTVRAKQTLERALELRAGDTDALALLALVFQRENEAALADRYFREALASGPETPRLLNNYGSFLFEQKRFDEAMVFYQRALADPLYPQRSHVFENLGMTALELGRTDQAGKYFRRAIRLNERQPKSWLALTGLSRIAQDHDAAQRYYAGYTAIAGPAGNDAPTPECRMWLAHDHEQVAGLAHALGMPDERVANCMHYALESE